MKQGVEGNGTGRRIQKNSRPPPTLIKPMEMKEFAKLEFKLYFPKFRHQKTFMKPYETMGETKMGQNGEFGRIPDPLQPLQNQWKMKEIAKLGFQ